MTYNLNKWLLSAIFTLAGAGLALASGGGTYDAVVQKESTTNPNHASYQAHDTAIERSVGYALSLPKNHAGVGETSKSVDTSKDLSATSKNVWFSSPTTFVEYGYSSNRDTRLNGFDNDVQAVTVGGDFVSVYDILVGGMFIYNNSNGDNAVGDENDSDSFTGSVYVSRSFTNWFLAGLNLSYTGTSSDTTNAAGALAQTVETDTYSIAPYISFFTSAGKWTFSTTPTYILNAGESKVTFPAIVTPEDSSTTGKFVLSNRVSYDVTDKFRVVGILALNQIVHEHLSDGQVGDQARTWLATGIKLDYAFTEQVSAYTGYSYDAFNSNFENHNFNLGLNYAF